jgi:hypothetical protein
MWRRERERKGSTIERRRRRTEGYHHRKAVATVRVSGSTAKAPEGHPSGSDPATTEETRVSAARASGASQASRSAAARTADAIETESATAARRRLIYFRIGY